MNPVVHIQNVNRTYSHGGSDVVALDDISLDIMPGEFVSLMGPSGSGKSTLLHIIAGIDRPTSGIFEIMGEDICDYSETELSRWRNEHIGFVFQSFNLIPVLTAYENVEMPLLLTSLSRAERAEHVRAVMGIVGLSDRMDHYPRQLSGGQEQRVAIARALVVDPDLILADEPTGDLDGKSAHEIMGILRLLNQNFQKTVVMVTHDPKAAEFGTITRHLDKGNLVPL